jgi:hypothetical protein
MLDRREILIGATVLGIAADVTLAQAQDRSKLLNELMTLEIKAWQDCKDRNVAGLKAFNTSDAVIIFSDGTPLTTDAFLKIVPDYTFDNIDVDKANAKLHVIASDVATLLYRVTYASAAKNEKLATTKAQVSSTYVRRDNRWQCALYQETRL